MTIIAHIFKYAIMDLSKMKQSAGRASSLMKALSSENRLMLLCSLSGGEKSVGDLAAQSRMSLPAVSQQLSLLRKDGLVTARRDGRVMYYSLEGEEARDVIEVLYNLYCGEEVRS